MSPWLQNPFSGQKSVRSKIMAPFIVLMGLFLITSLGLFFYTVSEIAIHQTQRDLDQESTLIRKALKQENALQKYTQSAQVWKNVQSDPKIDIALLYQKSDHQKEIHDIISSSEGLSKKPTLQKDIKTLFKQQKKHQKIPSVIAFKSAGTRYQLHITKGPLDPHLYVILIKKTAENYPLKTSAVSLILILIGLISCIIFLIYNRIIQLLTHAIDHLASVSKNIANGNLNQKSKIKSRDKLGELSDIFNAISAQLNEAIENLQKETQRSEAIISCIPEAIIVTDLDNRLIIANNRAEEMFNFSSNKIQGKFLLEYINNKDLVSALNEKKKKNTLLKQDIKIPDSKGQDRIYSINSNLVENMNKNAIGVITVLRDRTHEKQIEGLRDGFLRTVSHELRTPLTSVMGFIELVQNTATLTPEQKGYLATSLKEASNLKSLINDLLDLSQISAGKVQLHLSPIVIKELIDDTIITLSPLAKGKQLNISSSLGTKKLKIYADLPKLRRILLNLMSNAIKFTESGRIDIHCKELEDSLEFSVQDTGIGLREDEKEIIFEKFRQIDYSDKRKYDGIGLGLSIVKQLVEMHHGTIRVESEYEKGSTFIFTIKKNLNKVSTSKKEKDDKKSPKPSKEKPT